MKIIPTEHEEQAALFQYFSMKAAQYPELAYAFAIPNGGLRNVIVAKKLKASGVRAGVPDLFIPAPKKIAGKVWHGLFVEMKRQKDGRVSPIQKEFMAGLHKMGYGCIVCAGWQSAWLKIAAYLDCIDGFEID
jgi:hypothetical protein